MHSTFRGPLFTIDVRSRKNLVEGSILRPKGNNLGGFKSTIRYYIAASISREFKVLKYYPLQILKQGCIKGCWDRNQPEVNPNWPEPEILNFMYKKLVFFYYGYNHKLHA